MVRAAFSKPFLIYRGRKHQSIAANMFGVDTFTRVFIEITNSFSFPLPKNQAMDDPPKP
jgi:hypothetical protein